MTVQPNSLAAFDSIAPSLSRRQEEVLGAIRALAACGARPSDQDIADRLGLPINSVTGRRGELQAAGLIYMAGHKRGRTGRRVAFWAPVPEQLSFWRRFHGERDG